MEWSEKIKRFFKEKELNNRQVCRIMENYSEQLFSRQVNSKEPSGTLILMIAKYFPEADLNFLLKSEESIEIVDEQNAVYKNINLDILNQIEEKIRELKMNLSPM